jgi:hypothetical protein
MRVATIFEYLAGRPQAILEVASDRQALGVAALLVFSAGLARNYDRASLLDEPWRLLGPFVASLAISGPLFLTIYGFGRWKRMQGPEIGRAYLSFLTLYWMTAPLAWLYGIPYEAFQSPIEAVRANLWTLGLVSAWRVALMIRAVTVVFNLRVSAAFPVVMLVADIAALTSLHLVPLPVIHVMGGINPTNEMIAWDTLLAKVVGWLTLPVDVVLTAIAVRSTRTVPQWRVPATAERADRSRGPLVFAALAVALWASLLPLTQPAQILAHRVARTYRAGGPAAAIAQMSAHVRNDFPWGWQPPPPSFPAEPPTAEVLDTLEALADQPQAAWLRALYSRQFQERARLGWFESPAEPLNRYAIRLMRILERLPEGPEMARAVVAADSEISYLLRPDSDATSDERAALKALLQLAREEEESPPDRLEPAAISEP